MDKMIKNSALFGLILGGISVAWSMLTFVFGVNLLSISFGILNFVISIALTAAFQYIGTKKYRDTFCEGYMNYGKALLSAVFIALFASIISAIYSFAFFSLVDPGYFDSMVTAFMSKLEARGNIPAEQLDKIYEQTMNAFRKPPVTQAMNALAIGSIGGIVIGLIVSIFTKKERPLFD